MISGLLNTLLVMSIIYLGIVIFLKIKGLI